MKKSRIFLVIFLIMFSMKVFLVSLRDIQLETGGFLLNMQRTDQWIQENKKSGGGALAGILDLTLNSRFVFLILFFYHKRQEKKK